MSTRAYIQITDLHGHVSHWHANYDGHPVGVAYRLHVLGEIADETQTLEEWIEQLFPIGAAAPMERLPEAVPRSNIAIDYRYEIDLQRQLVVVAYRTHTDYGRGRRMSWLETPGHLPLWLERCMALQNRTGAGGRRPRAQSCDGMRKAFYELL